ncbi:YwqG family protein [Actinomadura oligospora]|uniref:YwqG family protein n=1 Tax=Actinomadura oligospora TaxID=111804 RepID=UPI00047A0E40|nr:YwqG family protein [Actinomadura oligospora]
MISLPTLSALAHEHLPSDLAQRFCSLLDVRGQILSAARPGEDVVGALGGEPSLPEDVEWPVWDGHGPLSFVASLDCASLSALETGLDLPSSGTLLCFYFDGQADEYASWVHPSEPGSRPGSRLLHVPAGTPVAPRPTPRPLKAFGRVPLCAVPSVNLPRLDHRFYEPLGIDPDTLRTDPVLVEFQDALWNLRGHYQHQVGGLPEEVQGDVEYEVADFPDDWDLDRSDPDNPHYDDILNEASRWKLLVQIASDDAADMLWGDAGVLYWLITAEDLAARRFDQARFTWQCH